jgi:hypothetical protein
MQKYTEISNKMDQKDRAVKMGKKKIQNKSKEYNNYINSKRIEQIMIDNNIFRQKVSSTYNLEGLTINIEQRNLL